MSLKVTLIVMSAGNSSRFSGEIRAQKQWIRIGSIPLWLFLVNRLSSAFSFASTRITMAPYLCKYAQKQTEYSIIPGGATRQESLLNALEGIETPFVLVTDAARACVEMAMIERILERAIEDDFDCIVPTLGISDTVRYEGNTLNRERVRLVQTPQLSRTALLREALKTGECTDESSAIAGCGGRIVEVLGSVHAHKLTHPSDLSRLKCLTPPHHETLVGHGFDVHGFQEGKPMVLGGVGIESSFGFAAHSDGDVALHALCDALLGAIGAGDIGEWFPDTDERWKGACSRDLLGRVCELLWTLGFVVRNVDITIMAQTPRIMPYKEAMERGIAEMIRIKRANVNIKATTTEKLGFIGRKEGVAVEAIASVTYGDWTKYENFDC